MLHLQPRVELEEVILLLGGQVEVLDRAGGAVAEGLAEGASRLHHLDEDVVVGDDRWALLEDLLVAPLGRAIAPAEGNHILAVADDLDLEVARALAEGHQEDGGAGHLVEDLRPGRTQRSLIVGHADSLAAATLTRLEHHRVADAVSGLDGLLLRGDACIVEVLLRNLIVLVEVRGKAVAVPRRHRDASGLGDKVCADLVA
mmetsp:Transcript_18273/g.36928  ORF Transcript_18273/g.36928 Transcript_18273/m.36928 type:complete len:201 (+) Transcript_18273:3247-3849(+)